MTGYELSRDFYDWSFENPEKVNPNHAAVYFFIIEQCNRFGWIPVFALPTSMAMAATGIKSYNTYIKALNDLIDLGFVKMVQKSKNQYTANFVALSKINKALDKALDKALMKQCSKQLRGIYQSIDSIIKQLNQETNKPINQETKGDGSGEPSFPGSLFSDDSPGQLPESAKGKKGSEKPKGKKEKTQFEKDCFNQCKAIWFEVRKPTEFKEAEGASLYGLIRKLQTKTREFDPGASQTVESTAESFRIYLQAINQLQNKWYRNQDLKVLNSKFDTIFSEIKNESNGTASTAGRKDVFASSEFRPEYA